MSTSDNTLGIGSLASVAWTPLYGVGLDAQETSAVTQQVNAAQQVAQALLNAAKSAINDGRTAFSLNDLVSWGLLGTLPTGDDSPGEWASFINGALDTQLTASGAASLNDWRRMADDLQRYAALQASRRDPSGGAAGAGGVTHANGQWYANGQALSLLDLFTAVRVNQAANYDDTINGYLSELRDNQRQLEAARAWGSLLRSKKPVDSTSFTTLAQTDVDTFKDQWGLDPLAFTPAAKSKIGTGQTATQWDIWLSELKSAVDLRDTDNQMLQGQIDQKVNRRSEVMEMMGSFARKESRTGSLMASNLD